MTLLADKDAVKATIDKYKAVIHSSIKIPLLYVMFVFKGLVFIPRSAEPKFGPNS